MDETVAILEKFSYIAPLGMPSPRSRNVEHVHIARVHHPAFGGLTAYLKLYPYEAGTSRGLVNEITAYIFARELGLPTPKAAFVIPVPLACVPKPRGWMKSLLNSGRTHYPAFGTQELTHDEGALALDAIDDSELLRTELRNWDAAPATASFDETIANSDRHLGNVYRLGREKYAVFDHGRLAVSPGLTDWERKDLDPARDFWNRLLEELYSSRPPAAFASLMQHHAMSHRQSLANALTELQLWWEKLIPIADDRQALTTFLNGRAANICDMIRRRYNALV